MLLAGIPNGRVLRPMRDRAGPWTEPTGRADARAGAAFPMFDDELAKRVLQTVAMLPRRRLHVLWHDVAHASVVVCACTHARAYPEEDAICPAIPCVVPKFFSKKKPLTENR